MPLYESGKSGDSNCSSGKEEGSIIDKVSWIWKNEETEDMALEMLQAASFMVPADRVSMAEILEAFNGGLEWVLT